MAGAVGSGPKGALQAAVVICLYVLGMVAAGSLLLVVARACYSSLGLCREPLPPRYGKMDAQAATERRRQENSRKAAAAEARRATDGRGEEPRPLPSPSGSSLGSAEEGGAAATASAVGYDLEAGGGLGLEGEETKAPEAGPGSSSSRSVGGRSNAAPGMGVCAEPPQGLPSPARFRLPPPPCRWSLLLHAADGNEASERLVAPIPRRPTDRIHHQQQQQQPPVASASALALPTLVPGVARSSASPASDTSSSSAGSASHSRSRSGSGSGSTRPRARAVGDGDGFGVRREMMMAVP